VAAVPIQIDGAIFLQAEKRWVKATMVGNAFIVGLAPGGGPIIPPDSPDVPPISPPVPIHPIWGPPGFNPPGEGMPPGIWGGPIIPPEPPIPPDTELPQPVPPNAVIKPAPEGGWGLYSTADSSLYWAFNPAPPSGAGPKR
jgi:hypothetical protein